VRKPVNDKVCSDREKVKGAAVYFVTDEGTEPQPDEEPGTDKQPDMPPRPEPGQEPQPEPDKDTGTGTAMGTDTVLDTLLKPSEDYIRKVYYPLKRQDDFIKKKAKRYKVSESEIVRIMFDYFMKNGKI
jgi:hypothetical protein